MRYVALLAAAVVGLASPVFAQDRTPPSGSLHALQAPVDWSFNQGWAGRSSTRPVFEGRSVYHGPNHFDRGPSDDR